MDQGNAEQLQGDKNPAQGFLSAGRRQPKIAGHGIESRMYTSL